MEKAFQKCPHVLKAIVLELSIKDLQNLSIASKTLKVLVEEYKTFYEEMFKEIHSNGDEIKSMKEFYNKHNMTYPKLVSEVLEPQAKLMKNLENVPCEIFHKIYKIVKILHPDYYFHGNNPIHWAVRLKKFSDFYKICELMNFEILPNLSYETPFHMLAYDKDIERFKLI